MVLFLFLSFFISFLKIVVELVLRLVSGLLKNNKLGLWIRFVIIVSFCFIFLEYVESLELIVFCKLNILMSFIVFFVICCLESL